MDITPDQYRRIKAHLPVQRGKVTQSNLQVNKAILFIAEYGCKWHALPKRFGNWHSIYTCMYRCGNQRSSAGVCWPRWRAGRSVAHGRATPDRDVGCIVVA
jgi:transposase